jgi:predicted porin
MMKKLLLSTAAVCGLAVAAAAPASASDLELGISGFFAGYGVYNNQDEPVGDSRRAFDLRKETEIHFTGETTLDNGLTVGVVVETNVDRDDDTANTVEESYAYMSGGWGRFNIGEEEAAPYLLQVAAPAADENIDGIQPEINSFDLGIITSSTGLVNDTLGYDQTPTGYLNKLTYFTPVFNGFQAGVSYTPSLSEGDQNQLAAITSDDDANQYDDALEAALRYEGTFEELDIALGAGFTNMDREITNANQDDRTVWNVGADFDWGPFGLGMSYMEDDNGVNTNGDVEVFVVGVDYHTGPYRFGASYYNRDTESAAGAGVLTAANDLEVSRWTGGVTYEYGPGMSFRGAIAFVEGESDVAGDDERDGYQITVGTQINF